MKYIITFLSILFAVNISYSQSAPVASNVSAATVKNTNASIHLVASDADFDSLTYSIVSNPSNGTVSLSGDTVTYSPTTDYTGTDTFTFKANDVALDSSTKTVTVKVSATATGASFTAVTVTVSVPVASVRVPSDTV